MSEHEYGDPVAPEDLPPPDARGSASDVSVMPQQLRDAAAVLSTMSESLSYKLCEGNMASRDFVDAIDGNGLECVSAWRDVIEEWGTKTDLLEDRCGYFADGLQACADQYHNVDGNNAITISGGGEIVYSGQE